MVFFDSIDWTFEIIMADVLSPRSVNVDKDITFETPNTTKSPSADAPKTVNLYAATFMDVAVLRCLFVPQWPEEGIFWALNFLYRRLQTMNKLLSEQQPRKRSNSLPIPKIEITFYDGQETKRATKKGIEAFRIKLRAIHASVSMRRIIFQIRHSRRRKKWAKRYFGVT